ncbi:MAG: hypothetical protein R3C14_28895 [Caldilineaceae bacterium]
MQPSQIVFEQIRPWLVQLSDAERLALIRAIATLPASQLVSGDAPDTSSTGQNGGEQLHPSSADLIEAQLLVEQTAWYHRSPAERAEYQNGFVALYQGEVVDHDPDRLTLLRRVRQKFGRTPVAVIPVEQTALPEYLIHHPLVAE